MLKRTLGLVITVVMLLGVFGLTACNNVTLDMYKTAGKAAIETYAQERKNNYCEDNWTVVCGIVEMGKQAIDEATNKAGVDTAVNEAKEEIRAVQTKNTFPSTLGNFDLEEFTNEFFESNTLILVPFYWGYLLYEYLDFYTVFVENGKINFLIEVTDPYGGGDEAEDWRLFAVIIPNEIFNKYDIGESLVFRTYNFVIVSGETTAVENPRELLKEKEGKSIAHRVAYAPNSVTVNEITAVSSKSSFDTILG